MQHFGRGSCAKMENKVPILVGGREGEEFITAMGYC